MLTCDEQLSAVTVERCAGDFLPVFNGSAEVLIETGSFFLVRLADVFAVEEISLEDDAGGVPAEAERLAKFTANGSIMMSMLRVGVS